MIQCLPAVYALPSLGLPVPAFGSLVSRPSHLATLFPLTCVSRLSARSLWFQATARRLQVEQGRDVLVPYLGSRQEKDIIHGLPAVVHRIQERGGPAGPLVSIAGKRRAPLNGAPSKRRPLPLVLYECQQIWSVNQ